MPDYRVKWEIDILSSSPEDAAGRAREIQLNPESTATCFEVTDLDTGKETVVDFGEDHE